MMRSYRRRQGKLHLHRDGKKYCVICNYTNRTYDFCTFIIQQFSIAIKKTFYYTYNIRMIIIFFFFIFILTILHVRCVNRV